MDTTRLTTAAVLVASLLAVGSAGAWPGPGRMAALEDVVVEGPVAGDVIVLAGDIEVGPTASVEGHVIALFGTVTLDPGARVAGRALSVSSLATVTLVPAHGDESSRLDVALRLLSLGAWLAVTTLLAFLFPARLRHGISLLPQLRLKVLALGLLILVTFIAALVAVLGLGTGFGVPLAAALFVTFLATKTMGLVVLGGRLGAMVWRLVGWRTPLSAEVFIGVAVLQLGRFVPWLGGPFWTVVSVAALGAGLFAVVLAPQPQAAGLPLGHPGRPAAD